jgi:hypothetical protein
MYQLKIFSFSLLFVIFCARADEAAMEENPFSEYLAAPTVSEQLSENLYLLGKVWGYLKYHHPRVTAGCFDWDAELLGVIEGATLAKSRDEASYLIGRWIRDLDDPLRDCGSKPSASEHFSVDKRWLEDDDLLGSAVKEAIAAMRAKNESSRTQYYVTLAAGIGNPQFLYENAYSDLERLDWRYRMIALFRYWNIIEYWFPYSDLISSDWDEVLQDFIPRFLSAEEEFQYILELMALIAHVQDGHANLWSALDKRPPAGTLNVPAHIRSIEGQPVVWRASGNRHSVSETGSATARLAFGDVILSVNDTPISELIESWSPYFGVSNHSALLRQAYKHLLRGSESTVNVRVERDGHELDLMVQRAPVDPNDRQSHDRDGDTLQLLSDDVAYLKLSSVSLRDISNYLDAFAEHRGLIVDIRNYPSDFVVFALGQHLVKETTPFARFTHGDLESPGTFLWTDPIELKPKDPFFDGRVVILVDESSQSQSEYTAMAFRAAPGAVVIGSQTAGADGNVSAIPLPGGHHTMISGIGVFYPDKSPTQQIGIVPDIVATPTIAGVRAGRDEVLERAIKEILEDEVSHDVLLEMTRLPHSPPHQQPTATSATAPP